MMQLTCNRLTNGLLVALPPCTLDRHSVTTQQRTRHHNILVRELRSVTMSSGLMGRKEAVGDACSTSSVTSANRFGRPIGGLLLRISLLGRGTADLLRCRIGFRSLGLDGTERLPPCGVGVERGLDRLARRTLADHSVAVVLFFTQAP